MRRAVMCLAALALGCNGLPVHRSNARAAFQTSPLEAPAPTKAEPMGECRASRRVRVVDAAGLPVENARVIVRQHASEYVGGDRLGVYTYTAAPVRTDAAGRAWVCEPDALVRRPILDGLGGGFTHRDGGSIQASDGERSATLQPPFSGEPRLVLSP